MTTPRRAGRPMPVDLMFGGDDAEALFESWLAEADAAGSPPVRVVDAPVVPPSLPDDETGPAPTAWCPPPARPPSRRSR